MRPPSFMRRFRWFLATIAPAVFLCSTAFAYQFGTLTKEADLKKDGAVTAPTISRMPKGSVVTASDQPVNGYFRVRTSNGSVGFIEATSLSLRPSGKPALQNLHPAKRPH